MNKKTILTSILLSSLLVSAGGLQVAAADNESSTTGAVTFSQQSGTSEGGITLPGSEDQEIETETGGKTKGALRLTHVPEFNFDQMAIASETLYGNAVLEKYTEKGQTVVKDISQFVQVEDVRGINSGWTVTVSAGKFMPKKRINGPLEKTHIILQEGQLFNTRLTSAELATKVSGFSKGMAISNDNQAVALFGTVVGENTDSSKTSLVFNDSYTKDQPDAGAIVTGTGVDIKLTNSGVQLKTVGTDEKVKDETYTAMLTWTVQDAK